MAFGLLSAIVVGTIAIMTGTFVARRRVAAWRYTAQRVGLRHVEEKRRLVFLHAIEGDVDGLRVRIEAYHRGKSEHGTRLIVDSAGQIPTSLNLRAEGIGSRLEKTFGAKEIEVGDPAFDDGVYARGAEEQLLARLDPPTRALVLLAAGSGGRVVDGSLRVEIRGGGNAEKVARTLETLLATARSLARPTDVVERLVEGLRSDPLSSVRLRCLDLLARKFPGDERARAAFREVLGAASPELKLHAAQALGNEGRETLVELATSSETAEVLGIRAVTTLGRDLPHERALAILDSALAHGRRLLATAVIGTLGSLGGAEAVRRLCALLGLDDTDLAVAAMRALGTIGDAGAEGPLIEALARDDSRVRLAATEALGHLGSAAAVAPLHAAVDTHLLDLDLRSAARQAIAEIQSRVPGASPGQMSLAEGPGEAGQVSLAGEGEHHAGRVSVTEE